MPEMIGKSKSLYFYMVTRCREEKGLKHLEVIEK